VLDHTIVELQVILCVSLNIRNKIWEAKCTYIYPRSSYSADRTFSEIERPRALLTFLYDKLHMEPLLPSSF
jgi:hypothetical protein